MSKETILASEEVNRNNILACVEHGNQTRAIVRDLEVNIKNLQNTVIMFQNEIKALRTQLSIVQSKIYAGGT